MTEAMLDELTPAQKAMRELAHDEMADEIHCMVCTRPIPEARARRATATCSEACKSKLDAIRQRQRAAKKCPHCLHPSTPEEREEFRIWRAQRGDVRSPTKQFREHALAHKRTLALMLQKAVLALSRERDRLRAQLEARNAPDGTVGPGMGIPGEGQMADSEIAALVEELTTLTTEAELALTSPPQPA